MKGAGGRSMHEKAIGLRRSARPKTGKKYPAKTDLSHC
jgi:hypothetical protein